MNGKAEYCQLVTQFFPPPWKETLLLKLSEWVLTQQFLWANVWRHYRLPTVPKIVFYSSDFCSIFFLLGDLPKKSQEPTNQTPTNWPLFFWVQWGWGAEISGWVWQAGWHWRRLVLRVGLQKQSAGLTLLLLESAGKTLLTSGKGTMVLSGNLYFTHMPWLSFFPPWGMWPGTLCHPNTLLL